MVRTACFTAPPNQEQRSQPHEAPVASSTSLKMVVFKEPAVAVRRFLVGDPDFQFFLLTVSRVRVRCKGCKEGGLLMIAPRPTNVADVSNRVGLRLAGQASLQPLARIP